MNLLFTILHYAMEVKRCGRAESDKVLSHMLGDPGLEAHVRLCVDDEGRLVDTDGAPVSLTVQEGFEINLATD